MNHNFFFEAPLLIFFFDFFLDSFGYGESSFGVSAASPSSVLVSTTGDASGVASAELGCLTSSFVGDS